VTEHVRIELHMLVIIRVYRIVVLDYSAGYE